VSLAALIRFFDITIRCAAGGANQQKKPISTGFSHFLTKNETD